MRARNGTKFKRCGGAVMVQVAVLSTLMPAAAAKAAISGRQEEIFHAGSDISIYSAQLGAIFAELGGKRPVLLIE